jgi:nicotinamide mononucleotide (NMN) deamidase PncC
VSNEVIAKSVIKKLSKLNKNLSVAESITGGGLARALTDIAGSS